MEITDAFLPILRKDVAVLKADNKTLYLEPESPDWISIENQYVPIFDLFNGCNSFKDIKSYIHNRYGHENPQLLVRQVENFIRYSNLLNHNRVDNTTLNPSNLDLKYVYLNLTDECNLHCRYCYAKERATSSKSTISQWKLYIDEVLSISESIDFTFTGGEPLLAPFIFELADYISNKESNCVLLTNATLIGDHDIAKRIASCFNQVRISIDCLDESVHARLRGPGVLGKADEAFSLLLDAGVDVMAVATITQLNKDIIAPFCKRFDNRVSFQPLYRKGSGRNCNELAITGEEYFTSLQEARINNLLPGYWQDIHNYRNAPYKRCAMGIEELSIAPNGDLFPCHMLHYQKYFIGNLNNDDIENLYYNSSILARIRELNVDTIDQCKECLVRNFCGAGCRARIDLERYDLDGVDPFCRYEEKSIFDALMHSFG